MPTIVDRSGWLGPLRAPSPLIDLPSPLGVGGTWNLAFRDEFDGTSIDTSKWHVLDVDTTPPWVVTNHHYHFDASDAWVADSLLNLRLRDIGTDKRAGGLSSSHYGSTDDPEAIMPDLWLMYPGQFIEARIKLGGGWFAFWVASNLTGNDTPYADTSLAAQKARALVYGVEHDILEATPWSGNSNNAQVAYHWDGYEEQHQYYEQQILTNDTSWHTVGQHWKAGVGYDLYLDGVLINTFTTVVSGVSQGAILNIASYQGVEGTGLAQVDYVRLWSPG